MLLIVLKDINALIHSVKQLQIEPQDLEHGSAQKAQVANEAPDDKKAWYQC